MSRTVRAIPAALIFVSMAAVALWVLSRPIEDIRASLIGFVLMTALGLTAIPALQLWIEE